MKNSSIGKPLLLAALGSLLFLPACAFGPLISDETARTVGQSNNEIIAGFGTVDSGTDLVFKWSHGFTDNFDVGLQFESLSLGVRAKYAFIDSQDGGWSFAAAAGAGISTSGGSHIYGDLLGSYLAGAWEPYGTLRFVYVMVDATDVNDNTFGDFTIPAYNYGYGQAMLGTRYWFDPHWFAAVEVSSIFMVTASGGSGVGLGDPMIGASIGARF